MKGSAKVREYKEIDIEKRENEEIYNHTAFGMVGFIIRMAEKRYCLVPVLNIITLLCLN